MALFDLLSDGDALADLFDRERAAILAGRFDILERLTAEKERLIEGVRRNPALSKNLIRLREMADRNQKLLTAMDRGVRAAAKRIETLRRGPGAMKTYDASGQRQSIDTVDYALHRRA